MKPSAEDMHSVMEVEDGLEPHDVFVDLGVLILEGRIPGGAWATGRGYGEGPHCAGVGLPTAAACRHNCDPSNNFLCKRAENFRKHMELLWQNSIPMCIEVLLCPDCPCGAQKTKSPEIANIPAPSDMLLEQWMITVVTKRCPEAPQISVRGLFQAVRSQLHFSQLSAWWSSSKGAQPAQVSYRVTVPGEAFASQFQCLATEHSFPVAAVARNTAIKVMVRTLPRMEAVPLLVCNLHPRGEQKLGPAPIPGTLGDVKPITEEGSSWGTPSEGDSLLGASLLDPPQNIDLFGRRFQSPSRGSSPSIEAPERLMRGRGMAVQAVSCGRDLLPRWREGSPPSPPMSLQHQQRRLGRHGLARRRDCTSSSAAATPATERTEHVVPSTSSSCFLPGVVDDRMQNPCTVPGKHHCRCAYDEDSEVLWRSPLGDSNRQRDLEKPTSCKKVLPPCPKPGGSKVASTPVPSSSKSEMIEKKSPGEEKSKFNLELSRREFEEVLAVLRTRNAPSRSLVQGAAKEFDGLTSPDLDCLSSKLYCDAKSPGKIHRVSTTSTAVTSDCGSSYKADLLLDAILRTSSHGDNQKVFKKDRPSNSFVVLGKCKQKTQQSDCDKIDSLKLNSFNEEVKWTSKREAKLRTRSSVIASLPTVIRPKEKTNIFLHTPYVAPNEGHTSTFLPKQLSECENKCSDSSKDINSINHDPKCLSSSPVVTSPSYIQTNTVVVQSKENHVPSRSEHKANTLKAGRKVIAPKLQIPPAGLLADTEIHLENGELSALERPVPSAQDKAKFRRSFGSAASMVFHSRTGLPLTSSPAPVRRGTSCFDFDSSLNSVSAIRSALFESNTVTVLDDSLSLSSDDTESEGSARSPCSPGVGLVFPITGQPAWVSYCYNLSPNSSLLGNFEESVLNGRLEPVSTVQGFTAELGASGAFCPRHLVLPVTVFFYTLGDNDKVSTPYLGHINLGKKGYCVPRSGTIQVTLFNPLGTVVKMFVVMYDLSDMPANSQTFLRQRTLYMPANPISSDQPENSQKYLRYLVHLRFLSSKSGRIFLHTDIRMIIFRKSDFDTATAHGLDMSYELRSYTHGPTNPKFSPRK